MKKLTAVLMTLAMILTLFSGCGASTPAENSNTEAPAANGEKLKIGIVQIVEHPSLDQIRTTFIDELAALGYDENKVEIDYQNAQNEMSNVTSICQKFVGDQVDLIVAIATPSAQGAAAATTEIPVLFSAVTDPISAGLVDSMDAPGGNCTGTSDAIPVDQIFALADELTPGLETFGFIYNLSEPNSVSVIEQCKEYLTGLGLSYEESTIANVGELTTAAESLVGKVDAFFSPIDNTVASGMVTVAEIAKNNSIPYYVAADTMVADGGLATVGVDYVQLGKQTASMAVEVLEGADPAAMPVQIMENYATVVNTETAETLGVDVSKYAE